MNQDLKTIDENVKTLPAHLQEFYEESQKATDFCKEGLLAIPELKDILLLDNKLLVDEGELSSLKDSKLTLDDKVKKQLLDDFLKKNPTFDVVAVSFRVLLSGIKPNDKVKINPSSTLRVKIEDKDYLLIDMMDIIYVQPN